MWLVMFKPSIGLLNKGQSSAMLGSTNLGLFDFLM